MQPSNDLRVDRISTGDDLQQLATLIKSALWDDANDMGDFSFDSLNAFTSDPNRVILVARYQQQLVGVASAVVMLKPYEQERWLYVDEVDTAVNFRQQGVGTAMMNALRKIAIESNCVEMWLGAEQDNQSALKLYRSLNPDEVLSFVGFTFKLR